MKLKIFNENVLFDVAAGFSKKLRSPAGSVFLASTKKNEPTIRISPEELPTAPIKEQVMRIPLNKKAYTIQIGAVILGPRRTAIIGGPKPGSLAGPGQRLR